MKRKRGRPKGSTKKIRTDLTDGKADSTHSAEDNVKSERAGNKEEGSGQCSSIEGSTIAVYMYHIILCFNAQDWKKYPLHRSVTQILNWLVK